MEHDDDATHVFVCSSCQHEIRLNKRMQQKLLDLGTCIICDELISEVDFERWD